MPSTASSTRPLLKASFVFNALSSLAVLLALLLESVLYDTYAVVGGFGLLMTFPMLVALLSGSLEGVCLLMRGLPVFVLALPTFVGFFSAYNLARLADISWGNRPAASAQTLQHKVQSLMLAEEDAGRLETWLRQQRTYCQVVNVLWVGLNIALLYSGASLVRGLSGLLPGVRPFLPGERDQLAVAEGAFVLCLLWSVPYLLQQLIALVYHIARQIAWCLTPFSRQIYLPGELELPVGDDREL